MNGENDYIKQHSGSFILGWTGVTMLSTLIGVILGQIIAVVFFCSQIVAIEVLGALILGGVVGFVVGFAQSLFAHVFMREYKQWIYASVLGWAAAIFLVEINMPISRCAGSSNAPKYTPSNWIENIHDQYFLIAGQIEKLFEGEIIYGAIYDAAEAILLFTLIGICIGIPQGIAQWLVIKKEFPRASILIWINLLAWVLTVNGGFLIGGILKSICLGVIWALIFPPLATALAIVWLGRKRIKDSILSAPADKCS